MNSPAKPEFRCWLEIGVLFSLTGNNSKHLENQRVRHHLFIIKMLQIVAGAIGRALFYNSLIVWMLLNTGCYIGHLDRLGARHSMVAEPVEAPALTVRQAHQPWFDRLINRAVVVAVHVETSCLQSTGTEGCL